MIKKISSYIVGVIMCVSCTKKENYTIQVFPVNSGYGYSIKKGSKIIIKQNYIPAITKKQEFCTVTEAKKVASFILKKIKKQQSPSIKLLELEKLKIGRNCTKL